MAGPNTLWFSLEVSSEKWTVIVAGGFIFGIMIVIYSWSLPRKIRNRVVHTLNEKFVFMEAKKHWE